MNERAARRVIVLRVLVVSLVATLGVRLYYLQIGMGAKYKSLAVATSTRNVITQATRGQILDDEGVPLVQNKTALVVTVDGSVLRQQKDSGKAVLANLQGVVGIPAAELEQRITPCGPKIPEPCWNGSPYQPVPVKTYATDSPTSAADQQAIARVQEHPEQYPGVTAQLEAVRDYPQAGAQAGTKEAAHVLGYLGAITTDELTPARKAAGYSDQDLIGRDGVESTYDKDLRGTNGVQTLDVDRFSNVTGTVSETPAQPGSDLVLSLDSNIQKATEQALLNAINIYGPKQGVHPTEGSAVVLDPASGHVLALASYPSYDPSEFTGGISATDYAALTDANGPHALLDRVTQGQYAPGSTFKLVSAATILQNGLATEQTPTSCPSSYQVGNQSFHNFEGEAEPPLTILNALRVSCDTVFYKYAYDEWVRDGNIGGANEAAAAANATTAKQLFVTMARAFGFGTATGIDLPSEAPGLIDDRLARVKSWLANKVNYCAGAMTRPAGSYLQKLDSENCTDGWQYKGGDAVTFAIGQGSGLLATPLQLASAYSAIANGGTLYSPRLAKAVVRPDGTLVRTIDAPVLGHLPVDAGYQKYLQDSFAAVVSSGTGAGIFTDIPVQVSGKTGTAEVGDKALGNYSETSWFASYAPSTDPKYVVVVSIPNSTQGAQVAAPAVNDIYKAIYKGGVGGTPLFTGSVPPSTLPCIDASGKVTAPQAVCPVPVVAPTVTPSALAPSTAARTDSDLPVLPVEQPAILSRSSWTGTRP